MLHRPLHGLLVAHPWAASLLAPAHHDQQGVVDRDPEADERDQELDHDRDIGHGGERPDQQERRRNGDERHQQRYDRHERGEDEREHDQRAHGRDQHLHQEGDAAARVVSRGRGSTRVEPGDPYRRACDGHVGEGVLCLSGLALAWLEPTAGRNVGKREGRPAVVGHER